MPPNLSRGNVIGQNKFQQGQAAFYGLLAHAIKFFTDNIDYNNIQTDRLNDHQTDIWHATELEESN